MQAVVVHELNDNNYHSMKLQYHIFIQKKAKAVALHMCRI